jgi:transcriptional regulator with XRE-family HTH domain
MSTLGDRIKARRLELEWTQDVLAEKARVSKGFLSDIEQGKRGVSASKLQGISEVLGLSLDYLVTGKGSDSESKQLEIPSDLVELARAEALSFGKVQTMLEMRQQIVAHRRLGRSSDEKFDWKKFYESVKDFIQDE